MQIDNIDLDVQTVWQNEYDWIPVAQSTEQTLTGAPDIQAQQLSYGRPIVLSNGWYARSDLQTLRTLQDDEPEVIRTLTLNNGDTHAVLFDIAAGGVAASTVAPSTNPSSDTMYRVTINLITVAPAQ